MNKYMKRYSISLVTQEMQIDITLVYHYTPALKTKMKLPSVDEDVKQTEFSYC